MDDTKGESHEPFLCKAPKGVQLLGAIAVTGVIVAARAEPWAPEGYDPQKVETVAAVIQALALGGGGIIIGIALDAYLAIKSNPKHLVRGAFALGIVLAACGTADAYGFIPFPLRPIAAVSIGLGILAALSGYAVALACNPLPSGESRTAQS